MVLPQDLHETIARSLGYRSDRYYTAAERARYENAKKSRNYFCPNN